MPPYQSSSCQIIVYENVWEDGSINYVPTTDLDESTTLTDQNYDDAKSTTDDLDCAGSSPPGVLCLTPPACRRRVSFDDAHQVHTVPSHEEYTYRERKSTWCSPYEQFQSRLDMEKLMSRLEKGKPCKKDMTYQGLDQWTPAGTQRCQESVTNVRRAVFDEQSRQWELQCCDPEALASRCASVSAACVQRALRQGKEDEQEVRELLLLEATNKKRCSKKCSNHGTKQDFSLQTKERRKSWWSLTPSRKR